MKMSKAILDEIVNDVYEGIVNQLADWQIEFDFQQDAYGEDVNTFEDLLKDVIRQKIKDGLP